MVKCSPRGAHPDRRQAALAPCYDFVSTICYIPDDKAALTFSRTKKFSGFNEDELKHLAGNAGLSETLVLGAARETVARFHEHWQAGKGNLPLGAKAIETIEGHLKTVPIAQGQA